MINKLSIVLILATLMSYCGENKGIPSGQPGEFLKDNLLSDFAEENSTGLEWLNRPDYFQSRMVPLP
jgi:hypothetical protein